jgi:ABC-type Na+ transport system ATPase subunit NatA
MVIRVVTNKPGIVVIHKAERTVVQCEAENRHIVRVHHAMREADRLPFGDQLRCARDNFGKEARVVIFSTDEMREVLCDDIIG